MKIRYFPILFFLCVLIIIQIINAQESNPASPKIVTLPGPNVEGIPDPTEYPNSDYKILLSYSLYFYEAQRSGRLPKTNRVPWRHDAALNDGKKEGADLSGGYFDAGDYMKFTLPLSWTLTAISWGGLEWFEGYELAGQSEYLNEMVKWGTDWLINAHNLKTNDLFVQIGTAKVDHNYFGTDLKIPQPRPAFKVGGKKHGTDVSGSAVAAFASTSILFKEKFNNVKYSNLLLTHAKRLYEFTELKQFEFYSKHVPEVVGLYDTVHFDDKLVWGALWLYKATGEIVYLNKARQYFKQFNMKGYTQIINWADNTCAAFILFAQLTNGTGFADEKEWKREAERYLDGMVDSTTSPQNKCFYTAGGLLWCKGESEFNSLNVPVNIAFIALAYAPYATTPEKSTKYKKFAISQIDYLLGNNPMKMPYVVGVSPKSPQNPHHGGAHGSTTNNLNQPKKTTNIIYGAVIGGPDIKDKFIDDRNEFNFTEVALDYNAAWQGLMAFQVINLKTDETNNDNASNTDESNNTDYPTDPNDANNNNPNETDKSNAEQAPENTNLQNKNNTKTITLIACTIIAIVIALLIASWKRAQITDWFRRKFYGQNDKFTRLP